MRENTESIRAAAKRLLSENRVDAVIGFRKGTIPFMNEPFIATTPERASELYWDGNCGVNLANYLVGRKDRVAVVAKGCDSRNIVIHILENQIRREQVTILGAPCRGMLDRRLLTAEFRGKEQAAVEETDGKVHITGEGVDISLAREDFLQDNCSLCTHRNPVLYDELLWDLVPEHNELDPYADVKRVESLSAEEKWKCFGDLIEPCIRCYACRNACPLCYCPTCFVDESRPQWLGKTIDPTDSRTFHFLRAYHMAGRCTDCGACERACPVGIKVRQFTRKLLKDVWDLYGYESGLSLDERPPLDTWKPGDPEPFIR